MKTPRRLPDKGFTAACILIFLVHIGVSLYIARHFRGDWDMRVWMNWLSLLRHHGFFNTVRQFPSVNYPPVTVAALYIFQKFVTVHGQNIFNIHASYLTKLPILILDWASLLLLFAAFYRRPSWRFVLVLAGVLLNPALLIIGPLWGQWDIVLVSPMIASLVLAWRRPAWSGFVFALALLVKQQAIIFLPVLFIILVHRLFKERSWRAVVRTLVGVLWPLVLVSIVLQARGALWPMIRHTYLTSVGLFTWVTMHAFNIWYGAIGVSPQTNDQTVLVAGLTYRDLSILALGLITLAVLWLHWKSRINDPVVVLTSALVISLAFFVLPTEMHERYILPAVVVACLLVYYSWQWLPIAVLLSVTASLNMLAVYNFNEIYKFGTLIAYVNLAVFIWTAILAWRTYRASWSSGGEEASPNSPAISTMPNSRTE